MLVDVVWGVGAVTRLGMWRRVSAWSGGRWAYLYNACMRRLMGWAAERDPARRNVERPTLGVGWTRERPTEKGTRKAGPGEGQTATPF